MIDARLPAGDLDPDRHITVCCGSTETMLATLLAVLNPGDEVLVFEPFYENYGPGCIIAGAVPVWVPLEPPDFSFDPDRLRKAVSPRTRAIIFNSPNNPSGKVFSRRELQAIADLERQFPGMRERLLEDGGGIRRFINLYVNEEDIRFLQGPETALKPGDQLSIVPAIAGGR